MFCTQCGGKAVDSAVFCSKCGAKLFIPVKAKEAKKDVEVHVNQNNDKDVTDVTDVAKVAISNDELSGNNSSTESTPDFYTQIAYLLKQDKKIEAAQVYRENTGASVGESQKFINTFDYNSINIDNYVHVRPEKSNAHYQQYKAKRGEIGSRYCPKCASTLLHSRKESVAEQSGESGIFELIILGPIGFVINSIAREKIKMTFHKCLECGFDFREAKEISRRKLISSIFCFPGCLIVLVTLYIINWWHFEPVLFLALLATGGILLFAGIKMLITSMDVQAKGYEAKYYIKEARRYKSQVK